MDSSTATAAAAAPHYLSLRGNWQATANAAGAKLEDVVVTVLAGFLQERYPGEYEVKAHPPDLDQFYLEEARRRNPDRFVKPATPTPAEGAIWYDDTLATFVKLQGGRVSRAKMGCIPDARILHKASGRIYFLECKHQGNAGNAQERAAKYATPSILDGIKRRLGVSYHPIGFVFSGDMVCDPKYIYEIEATFAFAMDHLLLWHPTRPVDALCTWVDTTVVPLLCAT